MAHRHVEWKGAPGGLHTFGPRFAARVQLLDQIFRRHRPSRALDIGCGRGAVTRILARRARKVVATEVTERAVEAATESLADIDNVEVHLLDLFAGTDQEAPLSGRRFGLVLLSEVLEHLEDDVGALLAIRRVLEDDGVLVVTVPRNPALWSLEDELWGHRRRYAKDDLLRKLQAAGFRASTVWTWGFPFTQYLVRLHIQLLGRGTSAGEYVPYSPPRPARPLLHLARVAFTLMARFEQLFKAADRGVGYIVAAECVREDVLLRDSASGAPG